MRCPVMEDLLEMDGLAEWLDEHDICLENPSVEEDGTVRYFIVTYRWKWLRWAAAVGLFPHVAIVQGISRTRRLRPMMATIGRIYSTTLRCVLLADEADFAFVRLFYYDDLFILKYRHGGGKTIYNADEELDYDDQATTAPDEHGAHAGTVHKAGKAAAG